MGDSKIIITASQALLSWLKLDTGSGSSLSRHGGKRVPMRTNAEQVNWCCHIMRNCDDGEYTLIGIETFSQYILLIPFPFAPPQKTLESVFRRRWMDDLVHLMLLSHQIEQPQVASITNQFKHHTREFSWQPGRADIFQRQFTSAEEAVRLYLESNDLDSLDSEQARELGLFITRQQNREMTANEEHFYPLARFVEDGLFRFARGLAERPFPDTPEGNFPCPHKGQQAPGGEDSHKVVSLADYRRIRTDQNS